MYLVSLKIQEGINSQKVIRNVLFNTYGLNIVVDDTLNGKGNNVGKTTFLRVIDICLGTRDRKYIWIDSDTGSENTLLKSYLKDNKVFAELVVSNNINKFYLKKELYSGGTQFINGEKINADDYRSKLNEIFFQHSGTPSFRQLIGKFVRIKQTDDSYGTLKFLHTNTSNDEYRNIYEFLYKLSDPEISSKKLEYKKVIKEEVKLKEDLFKAHSIQSLDELSERIRLISNELSSQEKKLDKYISQNKYKESIEEISIVKNDINIKNDQLESLKFKYNKVTEILKRESDGNDSIDHSLLKEFYKDVTKNIDHINVKFDELIKFNEQIRKNKIRYYTKELERIESEIEQLSNSRINIIEKNSDILNLLDDDNFEKYKSIHEKVLKNKEALGELNEIKRAYTKVETSIEDYERRLNKIEKSDSNKKYLEVFNDFFSNLSKEVIGQRLYLTPNSDFPLKLSNIDDGVGTGHRKTITLLLDISYVHLLSKFKINYPRFFVHDVLESLDEHNMKSIVRAIEDVKAQFVFAILKEKIDNYDFIDEDDIVLTLSEDNKLFKV